MVGLMAMFFPVLLMLSTLALQRVETQLGPQRLRTSSLHPDRCSAVLDLRCRCRRRVRAVARSVAPPALGRCRLRSSGADQFRGGHRPAAGAVSGPAYAAGGATGIPGRPCALRHRARPTTARISLIPFSRVEESSTASVGTVRLVYTPIGRQVGSAGAPSWCRRAGFVHARGVGHSLQPDATRAAAAGTGPHHGVGHGGSP